MGIGTISSMVLFFTYFLTEDFVKWGCRKSVYVNANELRFLLVLYYVFSVVLSCTTAWRHTYNIDYGFIFYFAMGG